MLVAKAARPEWGWWAGMRGRTSLEATMYHPWPKVKTPIGILTIHLLASDRVRVSRASGLQLRKGIDCYYVDLVPRRGRWKIVPAEDARELPTQTIEVITASVESWAAENQALLDQNVTYAVREACGHLDWIVLHSIADQVQEYVENIRKAAGEGAFRVEGRDVTSGILTTADSFLKVVDQLWSVRWDGVALIRGIEPGASAEDEAGAAA
jgi:hypothetical protein